MRRPSVAVRTGSRLHLSAVRTRLSGLDSVRLRGGGLVMAAGGSATGKAKREREYAAQQMRNYRHAIDMANRYDAAAAGERQVAAALLSLTGMGWSLLVDRRWPGTTAANVDMILVGPGGVFVIDVKNWHHQPEVVDGRLHAGTNDRHEDVRKLLAITSRVQDVLVALHLAPSAVVPVMVFAGRSVDTQLAAIRLIGAHDVTRWLVGLPARLPGPQVRRIFAHLEKALPAYDASTV